jgi:hypothetical protein
MRSPRYVIIARTADHDAVRTEQVSDGIAANSTIDLVVVAAAVDRVIAIIAKRTSFPAPPNRKSPSLLP